MKALKDTLKGNELRTLGAKVVHFSIDFNLITKEPPSIFASAGFKVLFAFSFLMATLALGLGLYFIYFKYYKEKLKEQKIQRRIMDSARFRYETIHEANPVLSLENTDQPSEINFARNRHLKTRKKEENESPVSPVVNTLENRL